ncbi:hypothetical protein QNI19_08295 [Cytophagaceae bacterium DM2B3-1]|uniref:YcxB-like protein domain-containing protein n=1 Tax=Xanthocytophaga flava TaxID=3048013 RepID=A0ABT7CGQ3_9BACT|nr:hypothetical protein [Xanthocytophaga flavus]MDJ1492928.1 hypothetical protein [Xanthocytophaga flavus]
MDQSLISTTELRIKAECLPLLRKRAILKTGIVLFLGLAIITVIQWYTSEAKEFVLLSAAVFGLMYLIILVRGYKTAETTRSTYCLVLNNNGIEKLAEFEEFIFLQWTELGYREEKDGSILIFNKSLPVSLRTKGRKNVILVPNEIEQKERLLQSLKEARFSFNS